MRSINNRYYFDYNATSPLAESVKSWLSKGDFPFANPVSIHHSGKSVRRHINEVRDFLYSTFSLDTETHDLFFHSGATEGIGNIIRGFFEKNPKASFAYIATDHSCVYQHAEYLKSKGIEVLEMQVDKDGQLLTSETAKFSSLPGPVLLNWTWVNNETGVVLPLVDAETFKHLRSDCYIHVDAVQAPGKVASWQELDSLIDAYTFSSHKFGALKGIGFSFVRTDFDIAPIVIGGGQQGGRRSGTENTYGAYSTMLALKDLIEIYKPSVVKENLELIKKNILESLGSAGELVAAKAPHRNTNTLYVVFHEAKSDITSVAFDLAGMDVSTGSACSSGAIVPSRVLLKMGYDEIRAKSAIRFSFSPRLTSTEAKEFGEKISLVVNRFSKK